MRVCMACDVQQRLIAVCQLCPFRHEGCAHLPLMLNNMQSLAWLPPCSITLLATAVEATLVGFKAVVIPPREDIQAGPVCGASCQGLQTVQGSPVCICTMPDVTVLTSRNLLSFGVIDRLYHGKPWVAGIDRYKVG